MSAPLLILLACSGGGSVATTVTDPDPDPVDLGPSFPTFADVTVAAGAYVAHNAVAGYWCTGQAWGDYDRDGWLDLYLTNNRGANTLLRNRGDGTFEVSPHSGDVAMSTSTSGGTVFADYDNDGWPDLFVCNWGPNALFHNDAGQGFTNVTAVAGVQDEGRGMSAAFGDYNGDGYLDLYVCNYFCGGRCLDPQEAMRDRLYRNRGDGTFENVSYMLGFQTGMGNGFIGSFVDFDNDGDLDIYCVNDKGGPGTPPLWMPINRNVLWRNDGPNPTGPGWVLTEIAVQAGVDARIDGMGIAVGDYDNDGFFDLAISDLRPPTLYHNRGDGTFENMAAHAGLVQNTSTFGLFFADFNHDCFPDLYIAASNAPSMMYENARDGTFRDVSALSGTDTPLVTIGAAFADYDRDGSLDFVVGEWGTQHRLYRNLGLSRPAHWFRVRLEGGNGVNRDAVGSRVYLTTANGVTQMQEVACGSSIGSGHDLALHFGVSDSTIVLVRIRWPDGLEETFTGLASDQEWFHRHP